MMATLALGTPLAASSADIPPASTSYSGIIAAGHVYQLTMVKAEGSTSFLDLVDAADQLGADLRAVRFEGESGSGEVTVIEGDTTETIALQAETLFANVNAVVPPIVGGIIESVEPAIASEVVHSGITVTLDELVASTAVPSSEESAVESVGELDSSGTAGVAVANDWSAWFPSDFHAEGYNSYRCTAYFSGNCYGRFDVAVLNQVIRWTEGHSPSLWPSTEWGLEFGVALHNYSLCDDVGTYTPGYWLNPEYTDWATNIGNGGDFYIDSNRWFDECGLLSHEAGVRYPRSLIPEYFYLYSVMVRRNPYNASSTYSAQFQAVHDDCVGDWGNLEDCMGLNTGLAWPFSGHQSETVINVTRYFSFPGCSHMHDQWANPINYANGGAAFLPAPMSYWATCFSNDWY